MSKRYDAAALIDFATQVCIARGMAQAPAKDTAEVLVEGDLMGHDTHGLQLLTPYLHALARGDMAADASIDILAKRAAVETWDGRYLPGPYLVRRALERATQMAREYGTGTIAIRQSSHIGALAAYLEAPARQGLMVQLVCSDPSVASVAPFGGSQPLFTPNPMAWGIPTTGEPIMIDISASTTTNGMTDRLHKAGQRGAHNWWLDADGKPTNDPAVLATDPPGSLLPLGGLDAGHKGYSLALFVEAMTAGLAGHGRADRPANWGATVNLQVTDVDAFGGVAAFARQTDWLVQQSNANKPANAEHPVRVPGQRALMRKREQLADGVALHPVIVPALRVLAEDTGVGFDFGGPE